MFQMDLETVKEYTSIVIAPMTSDLAGVSNSSLYLICRLKENRVVVIHVHDAQKNRQLSYPGGTAVVLGPYREIEPLHLLEIHRLVGHNLT